MLAVLVIARGEVVPVERLTDAVWGAGPPADPAAALQAYVSHLRRRLHPGSAARTRASVVVSEGRGYSVRLPPDAVDVWRFERLVERAGTADGPAGAADLLTEALRLWHGPPLADWADEPWAEAEIARLLELRAAAREQLMAARLALGESAMLVADLEAMVAEEPLREERWRLLALALYRAHRQADALGALRRARSTLADELGVDPGPALRELEGQVLAHSPALAVPAQRSRAPEPPPSRPAAVAPEDLLDRDREMRAVRAALDDLAGGGPGLLLIEGPAGIGKTRLLTEARRLAGERGMRVLTARGSQLEKSFGFGAVRQLFEPELATAEHREALLAGAAASARTVFDLAPGESPDGSFAVLHGLYWLAVNLAADGPLVLAVDDLQWCDSASLRWLAYLARRLDAVPVLVVGTVRTGEQHPDEELLAELSVEPSAAVVRPAALTPEATADLVERRLGGRSRRCSPLPATAPRRATRCCCASCCAASRPTACVPTRRTRTWSSPSARGPSPAWCSCGCAGSRARRPTWRGRPPSWGTARRCRPSPPSPDCRRRRPPSGWRRWPAARSSRTSSRWRSCTPSCGTPCTATCPPPSARSATSGRRSCCGRRGPATSRSPPICCSHRPGATPPPSRCCAGRRGRRPSGAPPTAPSRCCAGRWTSCPPGSSAAPC
ncbi:AAA family ATPase [Blastococcus sp. PRF04-17]|nr:AAA family ATPase [Blastococcus sp. PRF04-17]